MTNVSYDPFSTTFANNSFSTESTGVIQGVALDDPAIRNALAGGYVALTETQPLWGGVGISESIGTIPGVGLRGNAISRATTIADMTGFTVFNQMHHMITFPTSPVPTAGSGMSVGFYRFGSGARIPVKASPSLVTLDGELITSQISWDFSAQHAVPYFANSIALTANAAYSSGTVTVTTASAHGLVTGDYVVLSGFVPAGYNGTYLITVTGADTFTYSLATDPGAQTTAGTVSATGGALPVKILSVVASNAKTVVYDAVNNVARWNVASDNDSVALIIEI